MPKQPKTAADYIQPFYINGLRGRVMHLPAKTRKREIMYIQGLHTSLERNFGVAQFFNQYGAVTVPDLPGFGGMDPFYKIGEKPSMDRMADYLAAVIKHRYHGRKFMLIGLSYGFAVITRMLQKYPKIAKQIDGLVSFAGTVDHRDFVYKKPSYWLFRGATWLFKQRLPAAFLKYVAINGPFIRFGYAVLEPLFVKRKNSKIAGAPADEKKRRINFEVQLWKINDPRTHMEAAYNLLTLYLGGTHVDLKVNHVAIKGDRYFDNVRVEQHMRRIYKDFKIIKIKPPSHAPSIIASYKEAAEFFSEPMRAVLRGKY